MDLGMSIVTGLGSVITSVTLFGLIIKAQNKKIDDLARNCLMEDKHTYMCENSSLKITAHITEELKTLKVEIFEEIGRVNNNKQTIKGVKNV